METSQIRPIDKYVEMENESTTDSGTFGKPKYRWIVM